MFQKVFGKNSWVSILLLSAVMKIICSSTTVTTKCGVEKTLTYTYLKMGAPDMDTISAVSSEREKTTWTP